MPSQKDTIIVADDEPEYREMLKTHLEGKGYDVTVTESGSAAYEALEHFVKTRGGDLPKLVISDWMMINGTGIELLERIRKGPHAQVAFILMSGAVTREQLVGASKYDPDAIMVKPFSLTVLQQKIAQAIEVREAKMLASLLRQSPQAR